ncbi:MAG: arginine N-succinyltransferase, partial [Rubripirellula sp.]
PHRFADRVIAEMRGRANSDGSVPFWDAVAGRFIPVDFATADAMSTISKQFIEEMMPQHPIYLELLEQGVREGIGQVHQETEPAVAMLKAEGFSGTELFDIFDAGPVISAETRSIHAVQRTRSVTVGGVVNQLKGQTTQAMVASTREGFTSVLTDIQAKGDAIHLLASDAKQLQIETGSTCVVMTLKPGQES